MRSRRDLAYLLSLGLFALTMGASYASSGGAEGHSLLGPAGKTPAMPTFAYVANFGDSSVSGYSIDASSGALTPLAHSPFTGNGVGQPNAMAVDPSGKFLYLAKGNTNRISAFTINAGKAGKAGTGELTPVPGSPFEGLCPGFLAVDPFGQVSLRGRRLWR